MPEHLATSRHRPDRRGSGHDRKPDRHRRIGGTGTVLAPKAGTASGSMNLQLRFAPERADDTRQMAAGEWLPVFRTIRPSPKNQSDLGCGDSLSLGPLWHRSHVFSARYARMSVSAVSRARSIATQKGRCVMMKLVAAMGLATIIAAPTFAHAPAAKVASGNV